jgi:hypothetical protein
MPECTETIQSETPGDFQDFCVTHAGNSLESNEVQLCSRLFEISVEFAELDARDHFQLVSFL